MNTRGDEMNDFDFKKYLNLITSKKYLFVTMALVIMTGVTIASYLLPKKYEAKATVFIEKSIVADLVKGIAVTPSVEDKIRVLAYTIKSRPLLTKVLKDLDINVNSQNDSQMEQTLRAFQKDTDLKMKDQDGLFIVSFTHSDPRVARDYVNTLVHRYIEENTSSKREESYGASRFLGEQIAAVKAKLEEAEAKADVFRRSNGNVLALSEGELLRDIADAQERKTEAVQKRRHLESQLNLARKTSPLQARLATLQKRKQELSLVYTDIHPEVMEVNNQIAAIKDGSAGKGEAVIAAPSMEQEGIRLEINAQRDIEMSLQRMIDSKYAMLREMPAAKTGLEELEREKNNQKNLYEQLMTRYGQSEMSTQVEVNDKSTTFRIIDPAVMPTTPVSPQRVKMMLFGILGGFAGSFGLLFLLDQMDRSVKSCDSLKSLGVQILAVVPSIHNPVQLAKSKKQDLYFFTVAGAYFLLILAVIPFELLREISPDFLNSIDFLRITLK